MTTIIEWFKALQGIDWVLVGAIVLLFTGYIYLLRKIIQLRYVGGLIGKRKIRIFGILFGSLVVFYLFYNLHNLQPNEWVEISLLVGLVAATSALALYAAGQADASVKMAREMREQTIMSSRPWIIQKAIHEDEKKIHAIEDSLNPNYFSHFEIYNEGNGPAIELEISLRDRLDREGTGLHSHRETFLLAGKTLEFHPFNVASLDESKIYYLACEYQSILSRGLKIWYQTLLPFEPVKSSRDDRIYVKAGELKFKEVPESERIDAFSSRSKPK